jgi:hypothetical protein
MKKQYTIVLGKCYPGPGEEDWPTEENTSCTYVINSKAALYRQMNQLINSWAAPWWWIFNGDVTEDNLMLSGAIDPDDIDIIKENLS